MTGFAVQRASTVLFVPFFLAKMPPADFTRYGLFVSVLAVVPPLLSLRLHTAPARLIFDHPDAAGRARLVTTALLGGAGLAFSLLLLALLALRVLPFEEPVSRGLLALQALVAACCFGRIVGEHAATLLRAEGRAGDFLRMMLLEGGVLLGGCVAGLLLWPAHAYLVAVTAFTASAGMAGLWGLWICRHHYQAGRWDRALALDCLHYAWPTAFVLVLAWLVAQGGRWIGAAFLPLDTLAGYTLVPLLLTVVGFAGRAVYEASRPELGRAFAARDYATGTALLARCHRLFVAGAILAWAGIALVLWLAQDRLDPRSAPGMWLVVGAAVAALLDAWATRGFNMLLNLKRPRELLKIGLVSGPVALLVSFALCRPLGVAGLMLGIVAGFAVQALLANWAARQVLEPCRLTRCQPAPRDPLRSRGEGRPGS
ncbi:MAG TPA: hypothetical protein PKE47_01210 [Verrucomicrobiota bacterium]|nr:hypothetical protein [Verrucomicrobiota bacterium]